MSICEVLAAEIDIRGIGKVLYEKVHRGPGQGTNLIKMYFSNLLDLK